MCYAQPGPRCSAHALATLNSAMDRLSEALERDATVSQDAWDGRISDEEYRAHKRGMEKIRDRVAQANREYDATPEGIALLERVAAESPGTIEGDEAAERLAAARTLRQQQMDAYKAAYGTPPAPSENPYLVGH